MLQVLKTAKDLHRPTDLEEKLKSKRQEDKQYDDDVADSLLQLLAGRSDVQQLVRVGVGVGVLGLG